MLRGMLTCIGSFLTGMATPPSQGQNGASGLQNLASDFIGSVLGGNSTDQTTASSAQSCPAQGPLLAISP